MGRRDLHHFDRPNLSGIPTDWLPVAKNDDEDNTGPACIGLYVQAAGDVACRFRYGETRVIPVAAGDTIAGEVTRVLATGTTSAGKIFALQG